MALPKLDTVTSDVVVELDDTLTVTFQIRPIAGAAYNQILDTHRDPDDGTATHEAVARDLIAAAVHHVYSSQDSTPVEFTEADASEVWEEWPEWARWKLYRAVVDASTKGPMSDPFAGSAQNANAGT